jgi:hypothetical protein
MRFSPDACITCGSKYRATFDSDWAAENLITDDQGTFYGTVFWFCSDDCFQTALMTFVDKRYHLGRTPYTDPKLPDDYIEEFVEQWTENAKAAYAEAILKLRKRAIGEYEALFDKFGEQSNKELEQYRVAVEKKLAQEEAERQRKLKQLQQEGEKVQRELRQARQDLIRAEDRQRAMLIQQQKEADRQDALEERRRIDAKREAHMDEKREWTIEDRAERQRIQAKNEEWCHQRREFHLKPPV